MAIGSKTTTAALTIRLLRDGKSVEDAIGESDFEEVGAVEGRLFVGQSPLEPPIRARDYISEINRLMPQYELAKARYQQRIKAVDRTPKPPKRLDGLNNELTALKRMVLDIIKGV